MHKLDQARIARDLHYKVRLEVATGYVDLGVSNGLKYGIIDVEDSVSSDESRFAVLAYERCRKTGLEARLIVAVDEARQGRLLCEVLAGNHSLYLSPTRRVPVSRGELKGWRLVEASPWNPVPGDKRPWRRILSLKVSHG